MAGGSSSSTFAPDSGGKRCWSPVTSLPLLSGSGLLDQFLRRLVAGTIAGFIQFVCCHPFDTVKARLQSRMFPDLRTCVVQTLKQEGIRGLYRGASLPLLLNGIIVGCFYGINVFVKKFAEGVLLSNSNDPSGASTPPSNGKVMAVTALSAFVSAPIVALLACPVEAFKVRRQCTTAGAAAAASRGEGSSVAAGGSHGSSTAGRLMAGRVAAWRPPSMQSVAASLRAMYRGSTMMVAQRMVGYPCFFVGAEGSQRLLMEHVVLPRQQAAHSRTGEPLVAAGDVLETAKKPAWVSFLSGAIGGLFYWLPTYPFDVVKTRLVAEDMVNGTLVAHNSHPPPTARAALKELLLGGDTSCDGTSSKATGRRRRTLLGTARRTCTGVRAAYGGFGVTMVRSVLANSTALWTIERTEDYFLGRR